MERKTIWIGFPWIFGFTSFDTGKPKYIYAYNKRLAVLSITEITVENRWSVDAINFYCVHYLYSLFFLIDIGGIGVENIGMHTIWYDLPLKRHLIVYKGTTMAKSVAATVAPAIASVSKSKLMRIWYWKET